VRGTGLRAHGGTALIARAFTGRDATMADAYIARASSSSIARATIGRAGDSSRRSARFSALAMSDSCTDIVLSGRARLSGFRTDAGRFGEAVAQPDCARRVAELALIEIVIYLKMRH